MEDVFARQEATRERLETALGCDLFVKVYKAVQVQSCSLLLIRPDSLTS